MGKKRISFVTDQDEAKSAPEKAAEKTEKAAKKLEERKEGKKKRERRKKERGKRYLAKKKLVDRQKNYSLKEAVRLLKKTSLTRFNGAAEAHLVLNKKELSVKIKFPHSVGKKRVIALADDPQVMAKIKEGKIDFDVLLATPKMMPKLVPYARFLGPRGLMPNPKNGTIVNDPQKALKQMATAGVEVKTEKKAPLMHVVFGRVNQSEKILAENLDALIKGIGKGNIRKLVIKATMGPGIKVDLAS